MSDIKMIDKDADLINSPHDDLQYDIMISNRLYNISRYPEYVHSITGDKNNCYWVWPRTEEKNIIICFRIMDILEHYGILKLIA